MKQRAILVLVAVAMIVSGEARVAFSQLSRAEPSFHVSGVVLRGGTRVPVPRCHLVIRMEGQRIDHGRTMQASTQRNVELTAETDPQGRFLFDLPAEGRWQLSASAVGFRTQFYNENEGFSSAVVVRNGLPLPVLTFVLEPNSTVSGFVRDEAGEAVRNAVLLLQPVNAEPESDTRRQQATTDDRGRFEISEVLPGSYKVSVQATPWYTSGAIGGSRQAVSGDPSFDVVYPVTWYPGVLDSDAAGEIRVHSGEAVEVDLNVSPVAAAHLRLAGPSGSSTTPVAVPMIDRVEAGTPTGVASSVSTVAGQMEFGGLSPGLYRVSTSQPGWTLYDGVPSCDGGEHPGAQRDGLSGDSGCDLPIRRGRKSDAIAGGAHGCLKWSNLQHLFQECVRSSATGSACLKTRKGASPMNGILLRLRDATKLVLQPTLTST